VFVVDNFYFHFCGQILSFFSTKELGIFWGFFFWGSVNMMISLSCWKDGKILQIFISKQLGQKKHLLVGRGLVNH
jgi:hypothetical protein